MRRPHTAALALVACTTTVEPRAELPPAAAPVKVVEVAPAEVSDASPTSASAPKDEASPPASPGTALALLAELPVKGRAPKTGYSRDAFGSAWTDVDHNGCDTRSDILVRDLTAIDDDGCKVLAGKLDDPYTGKPIAYERGASQVDIDHVVALGNAWVTGAAYWTDDKRLAIANDPLNLLAVSASANRAKGDADAATWLPANKRFRCRYVARQVAVKAKHGLWVTAPEKAAVERVLASCPEEPAPEADPVPVRELGKRKAAAVSPEAKPAKAPAQRYRTCKEAKAAGLGPFVKGRDPEYEFYRDRDGDGVVCE